MKKQTLKLINLFLAVIVLLSILITTVQASGLDVPEGTNKGSLKITKYEVGDKGQNLLEGVTFDIYKVDDDETSTAIPTEQTILDTKQSLTTGADGIVTFSDLELGRYLVVESNAPSNVVQKIANFLVDIPMTINDGTTLDYDVEVFPKNNTVYGGFVLNKTDEEGNALAGVKFQLQKETTKDVWTAYTDQLIDGDLVTADDGTIIVEGLPQGNYRFVELEALTGYILDNRTTYNFTVSLDTDGSTKVEPETITVKNEKPELTKVITTQGQRESVKIGDNVGFTITVEVPSTIERLNTYKIEDTLSSGLDYQETTLVVKGIKEDTTVAELTKDTDYIVEFDSATRKITITFTNANLTVYKKIELTYDAEMNLDANATATGNNNNATLTYSTIVDKKYDDSDNTDVTATSSQNVKVYTGGFFIKKTDGTNPISTGAQFKVASSEANAKAGIYLTDENGNVITLTTDGNGLASYKGLTYGTYWLVETQAPSYTVTNNEGQEEIKYYNLLRRPVSITVSATSYAEGNAVEVVNRKGFELPETGGIGTVLITALGLSIIIAGIVVYKKGKVDENN